MSALLMGIEARSELYRSSKMSGDKTFTPPAQTVFATQVTNVLKSFKSMYCGYFSDPSSCKATCLSYHDSNCAGLRGSNTNLYRLPKIAF